jgi:hypothetical protein
MADLKGTRTEKNLRDAFAGESKARNKYTYFASVAKKEGYEKIAPSSWRRQTMKRNTPSSTSSSSAGSAPRWITCVPRRPGRRTNLWTCTHAWPGRQEKKVSRRLPPSSHLSERLRNPTRSDTASSWKSWKRGLSSPGRRRQAGVAETAATSTQARKRRISVRSAIIPGDFSSW